MRKLKNIELKRLTTSQYKEAPKNPVIVVLDNIRSMNNVGSVFRSSDAFRIEKIMLCGITARPPHRDIHKTAIGAEDAVDWEYFDQTSVALNLLRENGYQLIAVEQTDSSLELSSQIPAEKTAYVFGNEIDGVSDDALSLCDECVEIPQFGTKHSFNIAVSVGIVLWEHFRK